MKIRLFPSLALAVASTLCIAHAAKKPLPGQTPADAAPAKTGAVTGWLAWRGPSQNGTSPETGLPDKVDAKKPLWVADFPGQSTPVIANGRLYINGYTGDGADLREGTTQISKLKLLISTLTNKSHKFQNRVRSFNRRC